MTAAVKLLVGLVGVFWLFFAGIAYTAWLPAGWPNYFVGKHIVGKVGVGFTFHLPFAGAVGAERAKAAYAVQALKQATANLQTLKAGLDRQNASVAAWSARSASATAEAEKAVQQARSAAARADEARAQISAPLPPADDECTAVREVDRRLLENLQ